MENLITILTFPFFQNALLAATFCSIACGIIGSFIIVKRLSFLSGSIAHASFGGIGLGYLLGVNPLIVAVAFSTICAWIIGAIHHKLNQQQDILIGGIWAFGMAFGIICLHLSSGYATDLFTYLFGNILFVTLTDISIVVLMNIIILITITSLYKKLQAITFDEEYATIINLPVFRLNLVLLSLIALTCVILIKVVGIILVIALLTFPAASAKNLTSTLPKMMGVATLFALAATWVGTWLSYIINIPASATIILVATALYLITLLKK